MPETTLRRSLADAYGVELSDPEPPPGPPVAVWLLTHATGSGVLAAYYTEEGDYIQDAGEPMALAAVAPADLRDMREPSGSTGEGARLGGTAGTIEVLDLVAGNHFVHTVPAGRQAGAPGYVAPHVYWLEWPIGHVGQEVPVALMRAPGDLQSVLQMGEHLIGPSTGILLGTWADRDAARGFDFTDSRAPMWLRWTDANGETEGWERLAFPYGGTAPEQGSEPSDSPPESPFGAGLPIQGGRSLQTGLEAGTDALIWRGDLDALFLDELAGPGDDVTTSAGRQVLYAAEFGQFVKETSDVSFWIEGARVTAFDQGTEQQIGERVLLGPHPAGHPMVGIHRLSKTIQF